VIVNLVLITLRKICPEIDLPITMLCGNYQEWTQSSFSTQSIGEQYKNVLLLY